MTNNEDIVKDIMTRIQSILGDRFTGDVAIKLKKEEKKIRSDWGGGKVYVRRREDKTKIKLFAIEQVKSGIPVKDVAKDVGMSIRTLHKITESLRGSS